VDSEGWLVLPSATLTWQKTYAVCRLQFGVWLAECNKTAHGAPHGTPAKISLTSIRKAGPNCSDVHKIANAEQHCEQTPYTEFHKTPTVNV
jgi:hypothetical protein